MPRTLVLALSLVLLGCGGGQQLVPGDGRLQVEGGEIFYRVVGSGPGAPVITLHGGPGYSSYYLDPLAALGAERPVVLYDQLGSGRSEHVMDTSLFKVDRFVRELDSLRRALRIERFHLYGHSWGSMLALEYLATKPSGVLSVVLASPVISSDSWAADGAVLLATLPDSIQQVVALHEAAGTTTSPEYQNAVMAYMAKYVFGMEGPLPPELDSAVATFNPLIYETMWGPSEFRPTGSLKTFDRAATLAALDLPILFTAGRHDEARPETVERFAATNPRASVKIFERSAHLTMLTEPEAYVAALNEFFRAHDP